MNIRKPTDYSAMYAVLDQLMAVDLPQVELYFEIGRAVSARAEKGAAVAASEYLQTAYPEASGFSPRNLRRMREFYRTYENTPELAMQARRIGWTQNVVILEADLTLEERGWYLRAAEQFSCSKKELNDQIRASAHLENSLDGAVGMCYTEREETLQECENQDDKDTFCVSRQYLQKPNGRVCDEKLGEKGRIGAGIPHRISGYQPGGDRQSCVSSRPAEAGPARDRLYWQNGPPASKQRLRSVRSADWDGPGKSARYVPHLRRRLRWKDAPLDGVHREAQPGGSRSLVYRRFRGHLAGCAGRVPGNFEGNGETQRWISWLSGERRSMCSGTPTEMTTSV